MKKQQMDSCVFGVQGRVADTMLFQVFSEAYPVRNTSTNLLYSPMC